MAEKKPVYSEKGGEFKARLTDGKWQVIWFRRMLEPDHEVCDAVSEASAVAIANAMNRTRSS